MTSSVPPSVPNHIIGNNYNGSLMSLIPFQSSLCGIKKKKKKDTDLMISYFLPLSCNPD